MRAPGRSTRSDSGFTLVELAVAMVSMTVLIAAFGLLYFGLGTSATNSDSYTQSQESVRTTVRVLEADLRSADPLLLVPSSFTADPDGSSNSGTYGTTGTDIVAMFEVQDSYSACKAQSSATTTSTLPTIYASQNIGANVVWAYDPGPGANKGTLARYSYCPSSSPTWTRDLLLQNVTDTSGAMFTVSQGGSSGPELQVSSPTATSVPNQASPVCGTSITVVVTAATPKIEKTPFTVAVNVAMPNQPSWSAQACQGIGAG